jgi:serine/threonine-protein kinase
MTATSCPSREAWSAFQRGALSVAELESLASHLGGCAACTRVLGELAEPDVVCRLRGQAFIVAASDQQCLELEKRAQAIELEAVAGRTVSDVRPGPIARGQDASPLRALGPYVLEEVLGRGSMGIVYKARQVLIDRPVALKVLALGGDPERFREEGKALSRVRHPGVVQIYELNAHEGQLYYSMELHERGTLAERLRSGPLSEEEAAQTVAALALALEAVHQAGVLHRDLKPSNVLFGSDGLPRLADFGLAKVLHESRLVSTNSNAILGTLHYMAPEQASGRPKALTFAADIYALGAILYECLTGRKPFTQQTEVSLLKAVQQGYPPPPSRHLPGLNPVLEAICLKCLEKEPAARYQHAAGLAEHLQRWLDRKQIPIRLLTPWGRMTRAIRRHRLAALAAVLLFVATTCAVVALYFLNPERRIEAIEAALARGEEVMLIGEKGPPRWFAWRHGEGVAGVGDDGTFSVGTARHVMIELVRDPQQNGFALRAEVRHETGNPDGGVGLYFLHQEQLTSAGRAHYFGLLAFDDVTSPWAEFAKLKNAGVLPPGQLPPSGARATLGPAILPVARAHEDMATRGEGLVSLPFKPETKWRPVEVRVGPDGVSCTWDGQDIGKFTGMRFISSTQQAQADLPPNHPEPAYVKDLRPDYFVRGSLGLYLIRGTASFRKVVIVPRGTPN